MTESGGSARDAGPVIELNWNTRGEGSLVEHFGSDPSAGRCTDSDPICLQVTLKEMPIFDQDGTQVGRQHIQCTVGWHLKPAKSIDWFCSYVTQLKDGLYTDKGQLTGVGIKRPNGDLLISITGGTGAYENASGYIFQSGDTARCPTRSTCPSEPIERFDAQHARGRRGHVHRGARPRPGSAPRSVLLLKAGPSRRSKMPEEFLVWPIAPGSEWRTCRAVGRGGNFREVL